MRITTKPASGRPDHLLPLDAEVRIGSTETARCPTRTPPCGASCRIAPVAVCGSYTIAAQMANLDDWLRKHKRFHLHFTATASSWLDPEERWFRELTDKALRRGSFNSLPQLITAIKEHRAAHNEDPNHSSGQPPPTPSRRTSVVPGRPHRDS
ncbi:MAG: hypothetical protein QOD10_6053 [Mycobacterium sp.]|nr:hypothetical protein [Mycobacterium sp.]